MESNSSCNVESGQNLKQNQDAEETKSHVDDNSIFNLIVKYVKILLVLVKVKKTWIQIRNKKFADIARRPKIAEY
jgi:hypothetical protein